MEKNVASQIVRVWAWKAGQPYTGGAATITMQISKDAGALANSNDTNPTELDDGVYYFDLIQAETNCNLFIGIPACSDDDVIIYPLVIYTGQGLLRGTSGQYIGFLLWDGANDEAKTGDASNITVYIGKDDAALSLISVTVSEIGSGIYVFPPTATHLMCDNLLVVPISSTSGIYARPIEISLNRSRVRLPIEVTVNDNPLSLAVTVSSSVESTVEINGLSLVVETNSLSIGVKVNDLAINVEV